LKIIIVDLQYNPGMSKITSFLWRWGLALLMMAAIFGFSSIPSVDMPSFGLLDFLVKKGGHALGYGLLALCYLRGLKGDSKVIYLRWIAIAWALAVLYSASDEFHQSFVPGRYPSMTDVLIDSLGAAIAMILADKYNKQKRPVMQTGH
jgi:VanZ family protein